MVIPFYTLLSLQHLLYTTNCRPSCTYWAGVTSRLDHFLLSSKRCFTNKAMTSIDLTHLNNIWICKSIWMNHRPVFFLSTDIYFWALKSIHSKLRTVFYSLVFSWNSYISHYERITSANPNRLQKPHFKQATPCAQYVNHSLLLEIMTVKAL